VNPDAGANTSNSKKQSSKSKRKRGEQDEDEENPRSKRTRQSKPASKVDGEADEESGGETSEGDGANTGGATKKVPELLLAVKWDEAGLDPTGWWISEKLDGVRCILSFISRRSPRVLTRGIEHTLTERLSTADSATSLRPQTGFSKVRVLHRMTLVRKLNWYLL